MIFIRSAADSAHHGIIGATAGFLKGLVRVAGHFSVHCNLADRGTAA